MQDNSFITKMTGRGELPIGKMPGFEPPGDETHEIILERFKKQMRKEIDNLKKELEKMKKI